MAGLTNFMLFSKAQGAGLSSEYQSILDYAILQGYTLPSALNQEKQNALIEELKSAGIWNKLDIFYNFYTDGGSNFSKINWKNPGTFQLTNTASPTFTPLSGYTFGSSSALNTGFIPNSQSGNFSLNNASQIFEKQSNVSVNGGISGASGTNYWNTTARNTGYNGFLTTSSGVGSTPPFDYTRGGVFIQSKTASLEIKHSYNGGDFITSSSDVGNTNGLPTTNITIGRGNSSFLPTGIWISCFGFGGSLDGDELNFYNAWNTYKS